MVALVLGGLQSPAHAQTISSTTYPFATSSGAALEDISSGSTELVGSNSDGGVSAVVDIGFDFWFVGTRYQQFSVNANGLLRLGTSAVGVASSNNLSSSANVPQIAPYWDDLYTGTNGKVQFKVVGLAPERTLVVEWLNMQVPRVGSGQPGAATFQCWLHESTGQIEFVYGAGMVPNSAQGGASVGFGSSSTAFASVTTTGPTVAYGSANNANTAAIAAGTKYSFAPPVPLAPTSLVFSSVTAVGMTLDWTDNATNEVGYALYRSVDGTSYTFLGQLPANSTSSVQSGLDASTTYSWLVRALSEGALSDSLIGSQPTLAAGAIVSSGSGNWSSTVPDAPWPGGTVPTASNQVVIADGDTVRIDVAATCYGLTVGQGTSGILEFEDATARMLTVSHSVVVTPGGEFRTPSTGAQTGHVLSVGGDLTNDGTLNFSTQGGLAGAIVTFTGGQDASFAGSGLVTDLQALTVNKGSGYAAVLTLAPTNLSVQGTTAGAPAFLTLTNGTLRVSGTFTLSSPVFASASYSIGANAGLWLDNPDFSMTAQSASASVAGLLRMSAGTLAVGTGSGHSFQLSNACNVVIEGGEVNVAGRFAVSSSVNKVTYAQTGGTITAGTAGHTSTTLATFDLGTASTSSVTIDGGAIVLQNANLATAGPRDFRNNAGTQLVSGGNLQLGNDATPGATTFYLRGTAPGLSFTPASSGHIARLSLDVTIAGTTVIAAGDTIDLSGRHLTIESGDLINEGALTGAGTTGELEFHGTTIHQTYSGSGSVQAPLTGSGLTINNPAGLTIDAGIPANLATLRINLVRGELQNSSLVTLGASGVAGTIQLGAAGLDEPSGSFDTYPALHPSATGFALQYLQAGSETNTGYEVPASRVVQSITVNTTNGIAVGVDTLTVSGSLTLTSGVVRTSASNLLLLAKTITSPPAGSSQSYVEGPLAIAVQASSATNRTFAIGAGGTFRPATLKSMNTGGVTRIFTAEVIPSASGGTAVPPLASLTTTRYWRVANAANLNAAVRVNLAFGTDDNVGTLADVRVAQASAASGSYNNLGGTTTGTQSAGTVESTLNLTPGSEYFVIGSTGTLASAWDGGAGTNNWGDAANWSPDGVPASTTDVALALGAPTNILVNGSFSAANLTVGSNTTLDLGTGSLAVTGSYSQSAGSVNVNAGALSVTGTTTLTGGALVLGAGTLTSTGAVTLSSGSVSYTGAGSWIVASNFTLSGASVSLGSGTLDLGGNLTRTSGDFFPQSGTTILSGTNTQTINGVGSYYDLVFRNGGSGKPKRFTAELGYAVNNDFVVESTAQLALTTSRETHLAVWGNFQYSGITGGSGVSNLNIDLRGTDKVIGGVPETAFAMLASSTLGSEPISVPDARVTRHELRTDPATGKWKSNPAGGKPLLELENTYAKRRGEVERLLATSSSDERVVIDLDDMTIVRNPASFENLLANPGDVGITSAATAFPMPVTLEYGSSYTAGENLSVGSGRTLTVIGKLDCGPYTIGGAGSFSILGTGTVSTATTSPSGFGATVITTGSDTYYDGATIEYNAQANQTVSAANHPAAAVIRTGGSGTKTLDANITITATSGYTLDNGVVYVAPGTTFDDGGHRLSFTTSQFANVVALGSYVSTGNGSLSFQAGTFDSNVLAADGTVFGDLLINFTTATYPIQLNASGVANLTFRNITFGGTAGSGTAGGTLQLNETGTTNVTVTGDVILAPASTSETGGGFGGTDGTTGNVTLLGNLTSSSLAPVQPIFNGTGTNTLTLAGSSTQTLTLAADATVFTGSTLNLAGPSEVVLGGSGDPFTIGAGGAIHLGSSNLTTGANTLEIVAGSVLDRTTGRVVGWLKKPVPTGAAVVPFEIGTAAADIPLSLSFGNVTTPGSVTAGTLSGDHPSVVASGIDSTRSVNRHYRVTNSGVGFDEVTVTLPFLTTDVDSGVVVDSLLVRKYDDPTWSPVAVGTRSPTSLELPGVTSFSDFAIGEQKYFTLLASAGPNGSIDPVGTLVLPYGAAAAYAIAPDSGFAVADVLVDDISVGPVTAVAFDSLTADHTIQASFVVTHTIVASAGPHGSISPSGPVVVRQGDDQMFMMVPETGYHVADVLVDSVSVGPVTTYTFTAVDSAHTIDALFLINGYTITATAGPGGSITPAGVQGVVYGDSLTFTIAPDSGFAIGDVLVDSVSVGPVVSYTFANVDSSHVIDATFLPTYPIVAMAGAGGSIAPSGTVEVRSGDDQAFTITPSFGYHVADVLVDSVSVGAVLTHTFSDVLAPHTIDAAFALNNYTITASAGVGGSISPSGDVIVTHGDTLTFSMTPSFGYHLVDVLVDSVSVGATASYTFEDLTEDHTIEALFDLNTYTITALADAGGSVSPAGPTPVTHGDTLTVTITPEFGYHIADVYVDSVSVGAVPSYTFADITSAHVLEAVFAVNTYTILASAGPNGTITPSGTIYVTHGDTLTFAILPDSSYVVADVLVDSVSVGPVSSFTFNDIVSGHSIEAFFDVAHTVTASAGAGGSISPSGPVLVQDGFDQAFSITPDAGFHIVDVLVDSVSVGAVSSYVFNAVTLDHSIEAFFAINTYTVTAVAGPHGTITPPGATSVAHGDSLTLTIEPDSGYAIANVVVDSVDVGPVTSYTFEGISSDHVIEANFVVTYTILAVAGPGGTISPSGAVAVRSGDDQLFSIVPSSGYHVADVLVDSVSVEAVTSYDFTNVTSDHTVEAQFAINTYTITASAGPGGSIAPSGAVAVDHGAGQSFTITPSIGYHVADVLVDSVSVGAVTSYDFTNVTSDHVIEAQFAINTYTITASAGPGGSIAPSGAISVDYDGSQSFTVTPSVGYHVADVLVDSVSVGAVSSYDFTNVTSDHTIEAQFAINTYTITASAGPGGSITPSGAVSVDHGTSQGFTITPSVSYHVADVLVDSVSVGPVTSYDFTDVTSDHTIEAQFAINTYTITASAGAGGSITPSGAVAIDYGASQSFTITPSVGYHVADVLVDSVSVGAVTSYDFTNVTSDHTIEAQFAINTYTITASSGPGGSIAPSGAVAVDHGASQGFTITPSVGYHVADVLVDSVSVGAVSSYDFTNVTSDHAIEAQFAIDTYTITASAGPGGSIAPSGAISVDYDGSQSFTITPSVGYHVADVLVDSVSVGPVTSYDFTNVTSDHSIEAIFSDTYTITASAGPGGSIAPSGATLVADNGNQSFTITPSTGYHVADVLVDSVSVGAVSTYDFTNVTSDHTIEAQFAINTYTITASAGPGGSIAPSGAISVDYDESQSFTVTPSVGYHVADVLVDSVSVGAVTSYDFANVTSDHTIEAQFAINTYTITASAGPGGSIAPLGAVAVDHGASQSFTITPSVGYHVADVLVDSVSVGAVSSYDFTNVTSDHAIQAQFAINAYTITASAGAGGSIAPSGPVAVNHGASQSFTIAPSVGYHIADVLVDSVSVGAVTSYDFTDVMSDHTIEAQFAINTYTITASAGPGGSIAPSGAVAVDHGASESFTITASLGYHVADVLVDSVSVGAVSSYDFTNVTSDHTIEAQFAINTYTITASAEPGGSIAPSGAISVDYDGSQSFTIMSSVGYHVVDVLVDSVSVGAVTSYDFTNVTSDHTIEAQFAINTYTITASAGPGGSIAPSGAVAIDHGASQSFTVTPSVGYHVADVLVDSVSVGAVSSYDLTNVTSDHTIEAQFAINTYTITASAGPGGSIAPSGAVAVDHGAGQSFTITPSVGYHVADVLVDSVSVGAVTSYDFTNVTSDHTIEAQFAINTYTITAGAGLGGSIAPSGAISVDYDGSQSFTITPSVGYHVADVLVDSISVGAVSSYDFTNVTSDHAIEAQFAINTYTITASAGLGGSIAPSGAISVDYDGGQSFTITPSVGYHVVDVLVDSVSVGAVTSYDFTHVVSNHTIEAIFVDTYTITASAGAGGSIAPSGATLVADNGSQSFTITPSVGYHVADVLVDSVSVGAVSSYDFTNVTSDHTIEARFAINTYTITASAGAGGSIAPSGAVAIDHGASQSFTITPSVGYHVADVLVDSISVGAVSSYDFTNVTSDHTIEAQFAINTYTITASAGPGGSITPSGAVAVDHGASQSFTITPSAGYHVADVLVDSVSVGAVTSYDFTDVTSNHTIEAQFAINTYTITASAGPGGSIAPSGAVAVDHGAGQSFTVMPSAGYHVADVLVDSVSVGAVSGYDFTNVTSDHAIEAQFAIDTYTITASAGPGGSIAPSGAVAIDHGASQSFTITPSVGYHVADVLVDSVSVGAVSSYDFTNVTSDHTIEAEFAINTYTITASAGAGGSITPLGSVAVDHGESQSFTVTPSAGYHVADVLVDSVSVGAVTSYDFNNVTSDHVIEAQFAIDTYTITASAGAGGTIAPSGAISVDYDGSQSFTVTPSVGYHVADVLVDSVSVGAVSSYDFTNVTSDHTIEAEFAINTYTITASAGAGGSITPSGSVAVDHGASQSFTITPSVGYHVADVRVDSVSVGAVTSYDFTNVTSDHTIEAQFAINTYTITASAGAGGTIAPSGAISVDYDGSQSFTITPSVGYHVADVLVDSVSVGAVTSYDFTNVTSDHAIEAQFAIDTYTITASAGLGGSIAPSGAISVDYDGSQSFTITPSVGYHVADVLVDSVSVGAVTSYDFTNVTSDHTIEAQFAINSYTITASAGAGGSIAPAGSVAVDYGASQSFTITPSVGYHVADVLVDSVSVGALTSYDFTDVTSDHTIEAQFAINSYTITASAGLGGSIAPSGAISVDYDGNQSFTVTPSVGYHVADLLVDSVSVGAVTSYDFTSVTSDHTIEAQFAIDTYTITASAGPGGSIAPSGAVAIDHGASQSFTITPSVGYHVVNVLVDSVSVGAVTSYDFTNVTSDHTIEAQFAINTYTITASAGAGGSIAPSGAVAIDHGASQSFTITPSVGYHVADVLVDSVSVGAVTSYDFTNVTSAHTIEAQFAINTYTITASAGPGGSIAPSGAVAVDHGAGQSFTITPSAGYHVADVLVDSVSVGAVSGYDFTNVTSDHAIEAQFAIDTYTITASAGPGGSIAPSGAVAIDHGASQSFTITPSVGYHVADVRVDSVSVGAVTSYDFTNVTSDHTIEAQFAISAYTITASAGPGGSIAPSGAVAVDHEASQSFTVTPSVGYHVADVLVDSVSVGAVSSYDFTNVTSDHTIEAQFAVNTYTITASAGPGGSIAPSGAVAVDHGADQSFTITPLLGYHVADVLVDSVSVGAVTSYDFTNVTSDHTIEAQFATDAYTITASAGPGGSIAPSGAVAVDHGANQSFTITPSLGYHVADVLVDSASVGAVTSYDFTNVTSDHTIAAQFAITTYTITASAEPGGSVTPSGTIVVSFGDSLVIVIEPDSGFVINDVAVDSTSVGQVQTYVFRDIASNHTIHAIFGTTSTSVGDSDSIIETLLRTNAPNPFRNRTRIAFQVAEPNPGELSIFSVDGKRIRLLKRTLWAAGRYEIEWDGTNDQGVRVAAGTYFVRLKAGNTAKTMRVTLLR